MGRIRLGRIQKARTEQEQEKANSRKELLLVSFATAVVIGILAWNSPEILQNWHAKEYILPNK